MKFQLGRICATPNALLHFQDGDSWALLKLIKRHANCDWGDVCEEDAQSNNAALKHGLRLLSAYTAPDGEKVWIITEADRSVTTVLLPEDY